MESMKLHDKVNLEDVEPHVLEPMRWAKKLGVRVQISSGFRTPEENSRVGGVPGSMHLDGLAIDVKYYDWHHLHQLLYYASFYSTTIVYKTHVHFDMRKRDQRILKINFS